MRGWDNPFVFFSFIDIDFHPVHDECAGCISPGVAVRDCGECSQDMIFRIFKISKI